MTFICTGNSCRSQMAEGWARSVISSSKKGVSAYSAGDSPAVLNSLAVKVMSEVEIDISAQSSDPISSFDLNTFNFSVTVCSDADKHCPILYPQIKKTHWPLEDPAAFDGSLDERYSVFRRSRDEIGILVEKFIDSFFLILKAPTRLAFFSKHVFD